MNQFLIIGDVHQKVALVEQALKREPEVDQTIFIGDYFDDFDDNAIEVEAMAHWLKESLSNPKRLHLMGNHDIHYMVPIGKLYCSGFAYWKHEIINKILTPDDWEKLLYFHSIKGKDKEYWFSHAGITKLWFEHPLKGVTVDTINYNIENAKRTLKAPTGDWDIACLYAADRIRGGRHKKGGLLWNDWHNSEFFDNVTQIVGHTPSRKIITSTHPETNSTNINVDCHLAEVLLFNLDKDSFESIDNSQ